MSKANVGDLIRIVNAMDGEPYENGGIYEVTELGGDDGDVYIEFHYGGNLLVCYDEYEIYRKQSHAAQVGDLIRITTVRDEITAYKLGGIYEVTSLEASSYDQIAISGENGQSGYVFAGEYVVHRKAGEEDSPYDTLVAQGHRGIEHFQSEQPQDAVNPQHYKQGRVEVIDIIEDAVQGADPFEAVCQANVLKYALRYRAKNGVEDLRKMLWYGEKLVAYLDAK